MLRECTASCPHCGESDTTNVALEDYSTEYFVVTECVSCCKPYVLGILIEVSFRTGRVEMEQSHES